MTSSSQEPSERDFSSLPGLDGLIAQVQGGDEEAAKRLLDEFGPHIMRVVRRRLNPRLRERYDSQDFTQAVWASFFGDLPSAGKFTKANELIQFLCRVASNKVIDAGRRAKVRREQHIGDQDNGDVQRDNRLQLAEPTPSQHVMAQEKWDNLLQDEPAADRQLLQMRRQGLTQPEIAERLGISERQVRRVLSRLSRKANPEE
ncbi:MAG: sigma-70 family RNA polymerase sigma factor [Planctomycetaceae bacterium]|nr:sigma-70 family RNA polymerase sigma factor [Planctomycetaceae bacterium]